MLALVQRVSEASVRVDAATVGAIGQGLLVFYCAEPDDVDADLDRLLQRLLKLRCFADQGGRMNRSVQDVDGALLIVPQFTLAADTSSGNRPGFSGAAPPEKGRRMYEAFVARASEVHRQVASGVFGADMKVSLVNEGPVTLWLRCQAASESRALTGAKRSA